MPERRRFLRGMVAWVGFEQVPIEYRRAGRAARPRRVLPELFRLAAEALAAYSDVPLSLATIVGLRHRGLAALAPRSSSCSRDRRLADRERSASGS